MNHLIKQTWSDILFLNFKVKKSELRQVVPKEFELDAHESNFYISIVPFKMSAIKIKYLPSIPHFSLTELNLRTYVSYLGKPGIYFFTLDSNNRLANMIARHFFQLPYRFADLRMQLHDHHYQVESKPYFQVEAKLTQDRIESSFSRWVCERYSLFGKYKGGVFQGDVLHQPWKLHRANINHLSDNFSNGFGFSDAIQSGPALYSKEMKVSFNSFNYYK